MTRLFTFSSDGQNRHAYRLSCAKCQAVTKLSINKASGVLPPELVVKKLRQRGWVVGNKPRHDLCPECSGNVKPEVLEEPMDMDKVVAIAQPSAAAPKVMGKDERRLIFEKLNENYIDEHNGYREGWNDERVAKDLGSPRAWVSQVRDEMFGPEKSVATQALLDECRAALAEAKQVLAQIHEAKQKVVHQIEALERRIGRIAA